MVRDYRCGHFLYGYAKPGCPHRISVKHLDEQLWEKVWLLLSEGRNLEEAVEGRLAELRQQGSVDNSHLNLEEPAGPIHARFWNANDFLVEIDSIIACNSQPGK